MGHGAKLVVTLDKWSKNDSNIQGKIMQKQQQHQRKSHNYEEQQAPIALPIHLNQKTLELTKLKIDRKRNTLRKP